MPDTIHMEERKMSSEDAIKRLCWSIPYDLCRKLIFGKLTEQDMADIIKSEMEEREDGNDSLLES